MSTNVRHWSRGTAAALSISVLAALVLAPPAYAESVPPASPVAASAAPSSIAIPLPSDASVDPSLLSDAEEGLADMRVEVRYGPAPSIGVRGLAADHGRTVTPSFSVTAGWYLYVWLTNRDVNLLLQMTKIAAIGVVAGLLARSGPMAGLAWPVLASVAAFIVGEAEDYRFMPDGQCMQLRFLWVGLGVFPPLWARQVRCS